jgi:DNA helicase II / ATP-dependent DNA helicase PcrA
MPIPAVHLQAAQAAQSTAAHDPANRIRLIAGPGTGKSSSIEQRIAWLIGQGANPQRIFAVSFTRASAKDLAERIGAFAQAQGVLGAELVRVSTLHSLALRTLRQAGLLTRYPVDPLVLDPWELTNIFDSEFGTFGKISSKRRQAAIRDYYEAFWNTGQYNPPNYIPASPPVTAAEAAMFDGFHGPTSQSYSCVLPGEIVGQCVAEMNAGTIDPVQLLHVEHLIVDEFQDLNPVDLAFIDGFVVRGCRTFIAGDDDQSIYSFRYANPAGIQTFPQRHAGTSLHTLNECFRCMPTIVDSANALIGAFAHANRIPKNVMSLYRHVGPAAGGIVHRWRFTGGQVEAQSIASSCRDLIQAGIDPKEILILLNNRGALEEEIVTRLLAAGVPVSATNSVEFTQTDPGRLMLALLRIVINGDDYVALRTILGLRKGVGVTTTHGLRRVVCDNNLNYKNVFFAPLPNGVFTGRIKVALDAARGVVGQIQAWQKTDTIAVHAPEILTLVQNALGAPAAAEVATYIATIPPDATLEETRDCLWADGADQKARLVSAIYDRLGHPVPPALVVPSRVRIMTMHGAKGLSAKIVFIPGLEDSLLPGQWRAPYHGLVLEAARLLYVSITRARAACVISYASRRTINGQFVPHPPSRFAASLNGAFVARNTGLDAPECAAVISACGAI